MEEKKYKILIVDDEPDNVDLLFRLFRRNFIVLKAFNGEEALKIVSKEFVDLAVIVSDMKMPGMTGAEFLKQSLKYSPHSTRIILSGYSDSSDLLTAINDAKVYLYLVKPFDHEKLKEHVEIGVELYKQKLSCGDVSVEDLIEEEHEEEESKDAMLQLKDFEVFAKVLNLKDSKHQIVKQVQLDHLFLVSDEIAPKGSKVFLELRSPLSDKLLVINGEVIDSKFKEPKGMEILLTDFTI